MVAFHATGAPGAPATATPAAASPAAASPALHGTQAGTIAPPAGLSGGAIAGIVAGSLVVLTGIGWLVWRRALKHP